MKHMIYDKTLEKFGYDYGFLGKILKRLRIARSYFFRRKRINSITMASIVPAATSTNVPIFEVPNDGEVLVDCSCFFSLPGESGGNRFNCAPVGLADLPLPSDVALSCPLSAAPSGSSSL